MATNSISIKLQKRWAFSLTLMTINQQLTTAYNYMLTGKYVKARDLFYLLVSKNETKALLYLGWMSEQGLGGDVDFDKAEFFYKQLADLEDTDGHYYYGSLKLKQNALDLALTSFIAAASKENSSAAY
jgi:TPR repeat protein